MSIFLAIVALSVIILVHEIGHFAAAKACGIRVLEFSLFMGPKIFSFKRGETQYSVRWIPIGGYVKMEGEEEKSEDNRAFNKKPFWQRIIVVAAGAVTNIIFALLIFSILVMSAGYESNYVDNISDKSSAYAQGLIKGDKVVGYNGHQIISSMDMNMYSYTMKGDEKVLLGIVRGKGTDRKSMILELTPKRFRYIIGVELKEIDGKVTNTVSKVTEKSPALAAGILAGDTIVKVDSNTVTDRESLSRYLDLSGGGESVISVVRADGSAAELTIKPISERYIENIALGFDFEFKKTGNLFEAVGQGAIQAVSTGKTVIYSLAWLVTGKVSVKEMSGPVGIVGQIGNEVAKGQNFSEMLLILFSFMAFISLNIGMVQLIPFPALDGSKILIYLIEGIRRKALPVEKEALISLIGFVILISMIILISFNDIMKLVKG